MGPAAETFITYLLVALVVAGAAAWLGMPVWRRVHAFFRRWYQADQLAERTRCEQAAYRERAEREVSECLDGAAEPAADSGQRCAGESATASQSAEQEQRR